MIGGSFDANLLSSGIVEITSVTPRRAWIFSRFYFHYYLVVFITAKIALIFSFLSAVQIYVIHIFTVVLIHLYTGLLRKQWPAFRWSALPTELTSHRYRGHLFITSRVYYEPTKWPAPSWKRILLRCRRGHGFNFRTSVNFSKALF